MNEKSGAEGREGEFLRRLRATFRVEAQEHLHEISAGLIQLEKTPAAERRQDYIEAIFREAHSLKGAARSVNLTEIESLCQAMESVFAELKASNRQLSQELLDLLHRGVDSLQRAVTAHSGGDDDAIAGMLALARQIESSRHAAPSPPELRGEADSTTPAPPPASAPPPARPDDSPAHPETVRLSVERLDALLLQAEELLVGKLFAVQIAGELSALVADFAARKREWSRNRALHTGHPAAGADPLTDYIEWSSPFVQALEMRLSALARTAAQESRILAGMVDGLLDDMKAALMLPFSTLLAGFPKLVRDLARDQRKEVELVIQGWEIEADRRILEEIKDPLMHLVRNCIDHGLERPEVRQQQDKPPRGRLTIAIGQRNGRRIELRVADDGAGIDTQKVRATAVRLGILSGEAAEKLSDNDALALIYQSGFSTSPLITDVSGRGLGLAIVQEKVARLGGSVEVESVLGQGSAFRLLLPLTLSTFRGLLVRAGGQLFVLPVVHVERVARVTREAITSVGNQETVSFLSGALALVRLSDALGMAAPLPGQEAMESLPIVVLFAGEKRAAFVVDEVLGEQEVLVKPLGPLLLRAPKVAGATVLGTGQVAPVLQPAELLRAASHPGAHPIGAATTPTRQARPVILVAEDSITSRTLLKTILEGAGYAVSTAVDGAEAFSMLRTGRFDLLVSDVDMPRLNGLDLTAKIRDDKQLADLPVVLVTALEAKEDRERGVEVGANAYIVKSSFDQSNLLDAVRRLI